jgi:hypothetical protein
MKFDNSEGWINLMGNKTITVELRQISKFQFIIEFDEAIPKILTDEPSPLGEGKGPSPVQLLAAAVGNCLSDSLFYAFLKFNTSSHPLLYQSLHPRTIISFFYDKNSKKTKKNKYFFCFINSIT